MSRTPVQWWSPERDRAWFFILFAIGVFSILTMKAIFKFESQALITVVPCTYMLLYAALMWDFDEWHPRPDAIGDNLYYLGFLYTLTSLAHSLYRFSASETDTEIIVTNFGIAIATTILGMALRILLGRPSIDEPAALEAEARLDLAAAARKLRSELNYTVDTFRETLEEDLKSIRDGVETFHRQMEADFNSFRERLAKDLENTSTINAKTVNSLTSLLRAIGQIEDGMLKSTGSLIARAQKLEQSASKLTEFEEAAGRLESRVKDAVEAFAQHSIVLSEGANEIRESLQSHAEQVRAINVRQALHDAIEPASKDMRAAVEPASSELRAAAAEFKGLLDGLRQADVVRERVLERSEEATAALRETLDSQHELTGSFLEALRNSRDIAGSIETLGKPLSQFSESTREAARRITSARDELSESAERIRVVNEDLKSASRALRDGLTNASQASHAELGESRLGWRRWFRRRRRS